MIKFEAKATIYTNKLPENVIQVQEVPGELFLSKKMVDDISTCVNTLKEWKKFAVNIDRIRLYCDNAAGYMVTDAGKTILNGIEISISYIDEPPSILRTVDVIYKNHLEKFVF